MDLQYSTVKSLHVVLASTTGCLFALRAYWIVRKPQFLSRRWVKVVPHVVDTLLLVTGVALAVQIGLPGLRGWLPAKLIGLALYIALGMVALRQGYTRRVRITAALAALLVLGYIVCTAVIKSAWGPLAA